MMRKHARLDPEIKRDIVRVKLHSRPGLTHIHLIPCDFARVKHDPKYFDATEWRDGRIMTVLKGKLVEVVALS